MMSTLRASGHSDDHLDLSDQSTSTTQSGSRVTISDKINTRRKSYLRLLGDVHTQIANAEEEERLGPRSLTRSRMAEEIGCDKSTLSRKMKQSANITLESLAEIAHVLDRKVLVFLVRRHQAHEIREIVDQVCEVDITSDLAEGATRTMPVRLHQQQALRAVPATCLLGDSGAGAVVDRPNWRSEAQADLSDNHLLFIMTTPPYGGMHSRNG
jgi:transcriptional regulator with XRE-family HTH domain